MCICIDETAVVTPAPQILPQILIQIPYPQQSNPRAKG